MTSTGVEVVGTGPRAVWFVHGILGRGRNWRSFARRLVDAHPDCRAVLPDLRCHGESPPRPPPHDLTTTAADLVALANEDGPPDVVIGHSFGGKVALACLEAGLRPRVTWILDSPPGAERVAEGDPRTDPGRILGLLRSIPTPTATREEMRAPLRAAGISEPTVAWLLSSAVSGPDGWRFLWDLDGVEQQLRSYLRTDCWPLLDATDLEIHLVRAGRSDRWSAAELGRLASVAPPVRAHVLEGAGHWLHVDDPEGTWALLDSRL
jgi:pimeloyl-ACP methyl ester carboxylesterase